MVYIAKTTVILRNKGSMRFIILLVILLVIVFCFVYFFNWPRAANKNTLYNRLTSLDALSKILPRSVAELKDLQHKAMYQAQIATAQIIAIPDDKRTYENTMQPFDS